MAGAIALVRKTLVLEITCIVSNVVVIILQLTVFFLFQANTHLEKLPVNSNTLSKFVFTVSLVSSVVHFLLFFVKCYSENQEEDLLQDIKKIQYEKNSLVSDMSFNSVIYLI